MHALTYATDLKSLSEIRFVPDRGQGVARRSSRRSFLRAGVGQSAEEIQDAWMPGIRLREATTRAASTCSLGALGSVFNEVGFGLGVSPSS